MLKKSFIEKRGSNIIRKERLHYKIAYEYICGHELDEVVRFETKDRNEAIQYFLELFKMKQNGSMKPEIRYAILIAEIDCRIRGCIKLYDYKENVDFNEELDRIEKKLTISYETFKYSIKLGSGSGIIKKYETLFETENRNDAIKKFLDFFNQKQRNLSNQENIPDIGLEVAISPYDTKWLYLKYIKKEREIVYKLAEYEKDLKRDFRA